jgi:hypothetical protein
MRRVARVTVTMRELDRLKCIQTVVDGDLAPIRAAERLGVTSRQVRRLARRYVREGPVGLISKRCNRPSNNRLDAGLEAQVIQILRESYSDFGPTLAAEKLEARHRIVLSKETVRRLQIDAGLWIPRKLRPPKIQQPRARRTCVGELIQIDGCEHRWFEERAPVCTALVYVDDATSRLMVVLFTGTESTFAYFEATRQYLERFGKPLAFYSDKASIFRVNRAAMGGDGHTQFARALYELNIDGLCANTPAAKGRVERAHSTLQDSLVKELRLQRISTQREANAFAATFIEDYNARFAKPAYLPHDVHRPLLAQESLDDTFTWQEQRSVSQALTLQYDKVMYLLEPTSENRALCGKRVLVIYYPDNRIRIFSDGRELLYRQFDKLTQTHQGEIVANKRLGAMLSYIQQRQLDLPQQKRSIKCPTRRYPAPAANS